MAGTCLVLEGEPLGLRTSFLGSAEGWNGGCEPLRGATEGHEAALCFHAESLALVFDRCVAAKVRGKRPEVEVHRVALELVEGCVHKGKKGGKRANEAGGLAGGLLGLNKSKEVFTPHPGTISTHRRLQVLHRLKDEASEAHNGRKIQHPSLEHLLEQRCVEDFAVGRMKVWPPRGRSFEPGAYLSDECQQGPCVQGMIREAEIIERHAGFHDTVLGVLNVERPIIAACCDLCFVKGPLRTPITCLHQCADGNVATALDCGWSQGVYESLPEELLHGALHAAQHCLLAELLLPPLAGRRCVAREQGAVRARCRELGGLWESGQLKFGVQDELMGQALVD
mmetsp:Transcript_29034/g.84790  ORF Transcript_29034/g.84790 Transcript_29034/m.84790 type:complete len:339 (-) Transcript_29034:1231-2247(-)